MHGQRGRGGHELRHARARIPIFSAYEYPTTSTTILKFKNGSVGKCAAVVDCLQPYYFHTHLVGSEGSLLDNKFHSQKLAGLNRHAWSQLSMKMLDSGDVTDHPYQTQFQAFFDALDAGQGHAAHELRRRLRHAPRHRRRGQVGGRETARQAVRNPGRVAHPASGSTMPCALAIAAHPDDIEFVMAGTLLLLGEAGWEIHYLNLSSGNLGSTTMSPAQTARVRRREAQAAARELGATWHAPFCNDLEIFYDARDAAPARARSSARWRPDVILTHSPQDYMEDHMNTCAPRGVGGVRCGHARAIETIAGPAARRRSP